ncbi:hypothetical protein [Streptomyces sp. TRM68367]|uniref:hypothetical protein n=1 Tax=Streptomyces sp. TRM68367 TaxID=2758415 RepID=UPI00165B23BD|nr:hypothetical protein [Streptomyces sp. TRM68367]MBC9724767.1 hypothetical protein [Streptomyces sp. TRM68367]
MLIPYSYNCLGFALLLGAGIDRAIRRRPARVPWAAAAAVLIALVPVSLHLRPPESRHDDVVAIGRAVPEAGHPGDGLLHLPGRHHV